MTKWYLSDQDGFYSTLHEDSPVIKIWIEHMFFEMKECYCVMRGDIKDKGLNVSKNYWIAAFPDEQSALDYIEFLKEKFIEEMYNE